MTPEELRTWAIKFTYMPLPNEYVVAWYADHLGVPHEEVKEALREEYARREMVKRLNGE